MDKLRVSVKDNTDRGVRTTVSDESYGLVLGDPELSDDVQDRCGLIVESLRCALGIIPVEAGQCNRECMRAVGFQVFKHFIPRPSA
jgi:hypothetical protein